MSEELVGWVECNETHQFLVQLGDGFRGAQPNNAFFKEDSRLRGNDVESAGLTRETLL